MTHNSVKTFDRVDKAFNNLDSCIRYIQQNFPQDETIEIEVIDINTGKKGKGSIPKYFYRGEDYAYPTTTSSLQRLNDDKNLSATTKDKIRGITGRIDLELQKFSNISPMYSAAYLQHYGLPSELLDIASNLKIASFFASCGKVGNTGLVCVLSAKEIHSKSITIDLKDQPAAERPRLQFAYAFFHNKFIDLKDADCIATLKLNWFSFVLSETDINLYHVEKEILNAYTDKVAGIIQLLVDDFEKQEDEIAKWLADKIIPAPFLAKIIDYWEHKPQQPKTIELISMKEAGLEYNPEVESDNNYKKWSLLHPEIRPHKLKSLVPSYPLE